MLSKHNKLYSYISFLWDFSQQKKFTESTLLTVHVCKAAEAYSPSKFIPCSITKLYVYTPAEKMLLIRVTVQICPFLKYFFLCQNYQLNRLYLGCIKFKRYNKKIKNIYDLLWINPYLLYYLLTSVIITDRLDWTYMCSIFWTHTSC